MSRYSATPEEIGRMRREIRECIKQEKATGACAFNPILKAATLDDQSWVWLLERLRPAESRWIQRECKRDALGKPVETVHAYPDNYATITVAKVKL